MKPSGFLNFNFIFTGISLEKKSCTDTLQTWHHPSKRYKLEDIGKKICDHVPTFIPETMNGINLPEVDQTDFLQNLIINHRLPRAGLLKNRNINSEAYFHDHCYFKNHAIALLDQINNVSEDDIIRIEKETRKQSKCNMWIDLRKTRLTASVAHEIAATGNVSFHSRRLCHKISNNYKIL